MTQHKHPTRRRLARRLFPTLLAALGLWLLAGCFYLPIPEHRIDSKQPDFRDLVKDGRRPAPIRAGISRAAVIAILGPPRYEGRHAVGYRLYTESGLWVWPLCFSATSAARFEYAMDLTFNENDVLVRIESAHGDVSQSYFLVLMPRPLEKFPFQESDGVKKDLSGD
jgi:hypothetical protein